MLEPRLHLVDATLFYSPTSGGVRRYLRAKHAWVRSEPGLMHSVLVPGEATRLNPGGLSTILGTLIPGTFNYRLPLNPRRWRQMLEALQPDLIEVGDAFHTAWVADGVARRRGIPLTAFFHSNLPQLVGRRCGAWLHDAATAYVRNLYSRFDCVFAPSRFVRDYLQSIGLARVVYQPLGVDADVFHPRHRSSDLRSELGLPPDARLLVYAGRFSAEKNLPVLREAFRRLGAPYQLVLVGGAEQGSLEHNVRRVPYCRDARELATWLASADAFVHAGTEETFGLAALEAMACGRPVVAANAAALPEIVDDRVGRLARPRDPASLAQAIASLWDDDLDVLGAHARARVLERFTWPRVFSGQLITSLALAAPRSSQPALAPAPDPVAQPERDSANTVTFPLRSPTAT